MHLLLAAIRGLICASEARWWGSCTADGRLLAHHMLPASALIVRMYQIMCRFHRNGGSCGDAQSLLSYGKPGLNLSTPCGTAG